MINFRTGREPTVSHVSQSAQGVAHSHCFIISFQGGMHERDVAMGPTGGTHECEWSHGTNSFRLDFFFQQLCFNFHSREARMRVNGVVGLWRAWAYARSAQARIGYNGCRSTETPLTHDAKCALNVPRKPSAPQNAQMKVKRVLQRWTTPLSLDMLFTGFQT
eukprot:1159098-Pelagomonas_calceolata.AAC.11